MSDADAWLVAGPTASGKSAYAMRLAETIGGTVVNADSMQIYDTLRVVTARPSAADEARVPHALYGNVPVTQPMSAADYVGQVAKLLPRLAEVGRAPIFVGGTGLYFRALEEGLSPVPRIDPAVREEVRRLGHDALADAIAREDPAFRARDPQRMARALEVVRSTGRALASWHDERQPGPLDGLRLERRLLMPQRATLHERIAKRATAIVDDPRAREEIASLKAIDPQLASQAAKAIGVTQLCDFMHNQADRSRTIDRLATATRRYAKRQYTWFNNSLGPGWTIICQQN